ncbi:MAG TPA: cytochrome c biogenesis protein CcdA [Fimbriiglobus sp.]|jgi:thiol:disulfide interchange protein DsbD
MRFILSIASVVLAVVSLKAQQPTFPFDTGPKPKNFSETATLTVKVTPEKAKPGQPVNVSLTVSPKPFFWTYPAFPKIDQTGRNTFKPPKSGELIFLDQIADPPGEKQHKDYFVYYDPTTWVFKAVVSPKATPGKKTIDLSKSCNVLVCNEQGCLNSKADDFNSVEFEVLPGPAEPVPAEFQAVVDAALNPTIAPAPPKSVGMAPKDEVPEGIVKKDAVSFAEHKAALEKLLANLETQQVKRQGGLWALLATAALWGLISLVTPCVFPMIPITVSLFLKQSHQSVTGAVKLAGVYSLTIILVLGLSAITLLSFFRALSINPVMNIGLGLLFVVLALSLFGMFDLTLPGFLLRYAEGKRKTGGMIGAVFGAIAFSIVSFTCVAPFLGGFAGMASSGQYTQTELVLAGLAFASAFASPFFLLAMFPSLIKMLPKSGGWLDTIKVVMGFLEVAAAIKFFRTAELGFLGQPQYFTYDVSLVGMAVVLLCCGLYLLNVFRLPHDEEKYHIAAPRLLFAMLFLGLGVYLIPGTLKGQRPSGVVFAWIDAFLLPEPGAGAELPWRSDLPAALDYARKHNTLVFADFTGVTCTNCKDNERNVFPLVKDTLKKYTLVQMYTDWVPEQFYTVPPSQDDRQAEAKLANLWFQNEAFGTEQLPLYVIFEPRPNGKTRVVGVYREGKINHVDQFTEFVKNPLKGR